MSFFRSNSFTRPFSQQERRKVQQITFSSPKKQHFLEIFVCFPVAVIFHQPKILCLVNYKLRCVLVPQAGSMNQIVTNNSALKFVKTGHET